VKSLLFIIVVIVYLQYLGERSGKKKEVFAAYIIRLANRFSLLSCGHFRGILDVQLSIAIVPLSSSVYLARAIEKPETREEVLTPKADKTPRPAAVSGFFRRASQGETESNKQGQAMRAAADHLPVISFGPKLTT
jgi:hypothetical protein